VARTLSVTSITPGQIAPVQPGPPVVAGGIAQQIASLPNSSNAADQINGLTYTDFFSKVASGFGQQLSNAKNNQDVQTQSLAQAKSLRSKVSGV
jgi:flagellar hook-associated protein FlgK